jgi:hypothetical protein
MPTTKPTTKPTAFVHAGNDGPHGSNSTGISVFGSNFPPGTAVNIKADPPGRQSTALVQADGNFDLNFTVRPQLTCHTTVFAEVQGIDGIKVEARGDVFCPGDNP